MKSRFFAILGLAALATAASAGCAATTDDGNEAEDGSLEDDFTKAQLPGVVAVEIAEVRARTTVLSAKTLGAPKKVKSLVTMIKKLRPTDSVPRCLERDTARLTFLGDSGQKLATVSTHCGGFGSVEFESGRAGYGVKFDTAKLAAANDAPIAVGDALWGISTIELSKPGNADKRTLTGGAMTNILGGFNLDQVPDPNASFPRCLPSHVVTFKRASAEVAHTSFLCGATSAADAPASLKASFTALNPRDPAGTELAHGAIEIDPRPVLQAYATNR